MRFTMMIMVLSVILCHAVAQAQYSSMSAKANAEILHLIRKEKFDLILPGAMRDNNVEMWIHVIRAGNPDPMAMHFGSVSG